MKKKPIPLYRKKTLRNVTTCDYIGDMKASKSMILRGRDEKTPPSVVREFNELPGVGHTISVRAARRICRGCSMKSPPGAR